MNKYIYGAIGYTELQKNKHKVIIFADMHDTLKSCDESSLQINMAEWMKNNLEKCKILLEEVPREGVTLNELWSESEHTQSLKNLYLENQDKIVGLDIRPHIIAFSWEILESKPIDINFRDYLESIDIFYTVSNVFIKNKLKEYNIDYLCCHTLGKHFIEIKEKFQDFNKNCSNLGLLDKKLTEIYQKYRTFLYSFNNHIDDIMEWYMCANIIINKNKTVIIHAGLAHTDKTIDWLKSYNYKIIEERGITDMNDFPKFHNNMNGCIKINF